MTFNDIFKSDFINNFTSIPLFDMVLAMMLAFILGLFIFYIYKKTYSGVMYSASFGVTLIALTMITSLIILAVTSNIVLSLGMVVLFPSFVFELLLKNLPISPFCFGRLAWASLLRRV